jgi:hypothetical protein
LRKPDDALTQIWAKTNRRDFEEVGRVGAMSGVAAAWPLRAYHAFTTIADSLIVCGNGAT